MCVKVDISKISEFIAARRFGETGQFTMSAEGGVTLYSSCFAVMTLHYLGCLNEYSQETRNVWRNYLLDFQDRETGYFIGPELEKGTLQSKAHDEEHLRMHLCAHILPALKILGAKPRYPLTFAHPFTDREFLLEWLNKRDWYSTWLEGNNLLFIGQFLTYLCKEAEMPSARASLDVYFDWLDKTQDAKTGMWGTNGFCTPYVAMYGAYHQYLVYYYWQRTLQYRERIIDTVLSLQHFDGGFAEYRGGGTCEDIDAIDILVNMYKQVDYRRRDIRRALRRSYRLIVSKQMSDGGFVYKRDYAFSHMGMALTETPPNVSNMFSTWFYTHALCLMREVLGDEIMSHDCSYAFNIDCSMGWHGKEEYYKKNPTFIWEKICDCCESFLKALIIRLYSLIKGPK